MRIFNKTQSTILAFTLIEIVLVVGLFTTSMYFCISLLSSLNGAFSPKNYLSKDFSQIESILNQIKYRTLVGGDVNLYCKNVLGLASLTLINNLSGEMIDETKLEKLSCTGSEDQVVLVKSPNPFHLSLGFMNPVIMNFLQRETGLIYTIKMNKFGYFSISNF